MAHLSKLKQLPHWIGVGLAGALGAYVYAAAHAGHPHWTDLARYGLLPMLNASGALAWAKAQAIQLTQAFRDCPRRQLAA